MPQKFRVYEDLVTIPEPSDLSSWSVNDLNVQVEDWARNAAIPFVDLTPPLRAAAQSGLQVYFLDDAHWSADGHRVVGEALVSLMGPDPTC